jgi:biotin carboxylase
MCLQYFRVTLLLSENNFNRFHYSVFVYKYKIHPPYGKMELKWIVVHPSYPEIWRAERRKLQNIG